MNFIGNFKDWIPSALTNYMLTNDGILRPGDGKTYETPSRSIGIARDRGYDVTKTMWQYYNKDVMPADVVSAVTMPIDHGREVMWWANKLLPGNMMPMHIDDHVLEVKKVNCTRYWMPLQDYERGHVFIYKDEFVKDYKAGDLWTFGDAEAWHGAANIGYSVRLTFMFTTYDNIPV